MFDIHNHMLYEVDDGAESMEMSVDMLKEAKRQEIDSIILTPHYRHGMFEYNKEKVAMHFLQLCKEAEELGVQLYLGCEYHVDSHILEALQSEQCYSLASSEYVLTEYSHSTSYTYIYENTHRLLVAGYLPIIAHVERYKCLLQKPQLCGELQELGAMIQMNADSILGLEGAVMKRFSKKLLKNQWVDVVASDTHNLTGRANHLQQCYQYVCKHYGDMYAHQLFEDNPRKIVLEIE